MYSKINGDNKANAFTRTNSICPAPEDVLLEHVLKNNTEQLESCVNEKLLHYIYDNYGKPILLIACIEEVVKPETIQILIEFGAEIRYSDENQWEALHFAAKRADYSVLKLIIDSLKAKNFNINDILAQSSNALHILVRYGDSKTEDFVRCAVLLIEEGINVNHGDSKFMSPILWASKSGLKDIIKVILECSPVPVDIDSHTSRGQTARDIITIKHLYDGTLPPKIDNNNHGLPENGGSQTDVDKLFNYIKAKQENHFVNFNSGLITDLVNSDNGSDTLLQMACDQGSKKIVEHLIHNGADQLRITNKNKKTPLEIAADHGFHEIFDILLRVLDREVPKTVLISLLKFYDHENFQEINRQVCCNHLLQKLRGNKDLLDINDGDESKNSPLHYAVRYGDSNIITEILDSGASLGSKNKYDIMPIQDMEPELLEKHLDSCVQFDFKDKKDKEDFSITFKYRTLIPPTERKRKPDSEIGISSSENQELVHETEVISYMSSAAEFKHLLKHPVIVSFLFMKWHRIRWLFYTNLAFYIAFFASLVIYVFSYYANFEDQLSSFQVFLKNVSWVILLITFVVLMFRELFQMIVLPQKYFKNFENYIEIILILLSGSILFISSPSVNTRKQLSSLSILLSAFELILMVGQHPKLSTNVVMLKTVSYNFFKFLLWYSLLLIAFALSFYILFSEEPKQSAQNQTEGETNEDSFANPGKSVFKTIVMLTGEFEASDMNFETFPIVSKLIFVLFIFMIAIILLNLLNGLAVSDTQMIKNDAELLGHITRAQHIRYVEVMLLGNIVPKNVFNKIRDACCCLPIHLNWNYAILKPLAEKICLFPQLFGNYEMTVYPNRYGQVYIPVTKKQKCCHGCCNNIYLDKETIMRINELVQARKEQMKSNSHSEKLENEIFMIKKKLEDMLQSFNKIVNQNTK